MINKNVKIKKIFNITKFNQKYFLIKSKNINIRYTKKSY